MVNIILPVWSILPYLNGQYYLTCMVNIVIPVWSISSYLCGKYVCLFVALHPKSTAMVMVGGSVHLTTLFPGQA